MSLINYYSLVSYTVSVPGETYTIPFPYLFKHDISLFVGGEERPDSDITWTSGSTVTVANTSVNDVVYFRRYTRRDARWVDYSDGAFLSEDDLNLVTKQLLYLIQELWDKGIAGTDPNTPPGSGGDPGEGDDGLPSLIDDIIDELLQTQLFQDLVELIELTDINAETVMWNTLENHNNWSISQQIDQVVDTHGIELSNIGVHLGAVDAQIIDIEQTQISNYQTLATQISGVATRMNDAEASIIQMDTAITTLESATATSISQLQSEIDNNEALILTVEQTLTTADAAISSRIDTLEVDFNNDLAAAEARIASIEMSYVDETEATAIAVTQIDVKFQNHDWEGQFNSSSYIRGIEATANNNGAEITGIESFLVGAGADLNDPGTWQPGSQASSLAGMQQYVTALASDVNASADMRIALFSAFYPAGNPNNGNHMNQMISSMEETWQTYADSESSTVTRITSLEANTQPIFFRATAPDPASTEFQNTPWYNVGFPAGSLWHDVTVQTRIISYWWHNSGQPPTGITINECYTFSGINGMWVPLIDQEVETQGASITQLETAYNNLDQVGGIIDQRIIAVHGDDIAAINETLETYIDIDDGLLYSTWNVRINQYVQGVPVIAGVGLGMQQDPNNPEAGSRSDFIVMADYFSIVKPPSAQQILNGQWDVSSVFVPFVVNTGNVPGEPDVTINGDIFVRNTLSTMDGLAGRLTFTDLDGNGYPVARDGNYNATGTRLVLASDTNDYNLGSGGSYFTPGAEFRVLMWAGYGEMNHNNAVFYIDTDGNAYFGGEISAANITGDVGNVTPVAVTTASPVTVPNESTAWHQVGGEVISNDPLVPRLRRASATVSVAVFGNNQNAARVRLSMSRETSYGSNSWGSWMNVSEYPIGMDIGTCITLSGTHPTAGTGRFKIKVEIAREQANNGDWQYPSSNRFDGTIILAS